MTATKSLRALALAAGPGKWRASRVKSGVFVETTQAANNGDLYGYIVWIPEDEDDRASDEAMAQASYIAACSPDVVIGLLDCIDALEANAVRMREYRFALEGIETDGNGNPLRKLGTP